MDLDLGLVGDVQDTTEKTIGIACHQCIAYPDEYELNATYVLVNGSLLCTKHYRTQLSQAQQQAIQDAFKVFDNG